VLGCRAHRLCVASRACGLLGNADEDGVAIDLLYKSCMIYTFAHICNLDIAKSRQK
jgi:hypothetical protein